MAADRLLNNRLGIHDRKAFELKLEYQPSGLDPKSRYRIEMFMFLPASLNVDSENCPRQAYYADIHNYVRLKTPVLEVSDILVAEGSPLVRLERMVQLAPSAMPQTELVYQAKLLSCVFRGALRRFSLRVDERCAAFRLDPQASPKALGEDVNEILAGTRALLTRFRAVRQTLSGAQGLEEKTQASLRLIDEYMSLTVEQFFRKSVTDMDGLPRSGVWVELRKGLMAELIREEDYRRGKNLPSVLSPEGDNEEYLHRIGFLKKFCQNILFLRVRRETGRQGWEEVLFAIAAGIAMTFATLVAFWAQVRFTQVSLNFFLILVVGYMMKDRIKEGLRRIFRTFASQYLFDRTTTITEPVTSERLGVCKEKVDYVKADVVPEEIRRLRRADDFATVAQGELSEVIIRYQKEIILDADDLAHSQTGSAGVADIIRWNVQRLLRDMDDPELEMEYVDMEDLSIGRIRASKSYQVDVAFRFGVDDGSSQSARTELFRLVMDRNGIKRMLRLEGGAPAPHDRWGPRPLGRLTRRVTLSLGPSGAAWPIMRAHDRLQEPRPARLAQVPRGDPRPREAVGA